MREELVADFESADLSQREFAQERGLPISNLRYWIRTLRIRWELGQQRDLNCIERER